MPPHDIEILHEQIGEVKKILADLTAEVRTSNAMCQLCRPRVLGNGREGYDARIIRLEAGQIENGESRISKLEECKTASGWWITKILAGCAIIATIVSVAMRYFVGGG
jgi:hypothetical protein